MLIIANNEIKQFIPSDILLIKNVKDIATYRLTLPSIQIVIGIIICLTIILTLQYKITKKYKLKVEHEKNIKRIIFRILILIYICISPKRFSNLKINNTLEDNYKKIGAHTVFFKHLGDFYTEKPENYSEKNIKTLEEEYKTENTKTNDEEPNIIFIMNESFFEPNEINAVLSSYYLETQTYPYTSAIRCNTNFIVSLFRNNEYDTIGIHPYKAGFYNRKNLYDYLGFNKKIFEEDMENPEYYIYQIMD